MIEEKYSQNKATIFSSHFQAGIMHFVLIYQAITLLLGLAFGALMQNPAAR